MQQLEHQNDQLQSLIATQTQQIGAMRAENSAQLDALRSQLRNTEAAAQRQHGELCELRTANETLRIQATAHAACPQEVHNANAQICRLQSHINQLANEQQTAAQAHISSGQELHADNERLKRQLADERKAHGHASAARDALDEEMATVRQTRDQNAVQLERQRKRLTAELNESTDAICSLNADCARQRLELDEMRGRQESVQSTYAQLHAKLVQDWDALRQRADERMQLIKTNAQRIRALEGDNLVLRTETGRMAKEVSFTRGTCCPYLQLPIFILASISQQRSANKSRTCANGLPLCRAAKRYAPIC